MMERYRSQQRVDIKKIYYGNSESVASTLRALRLIDGRNNHPSGSTIERIVEKFEFTGTVQNVLVSVRQRSVVVSRLQLKKAQMCLSHVVLKRWASL